MAKERPIIFSGEMVRAILEGRKTQTRRVISNITYENLPGESQPIACVKDWDGGPSRLDMMTSGTECCPYGVPGDRLWVRETWGVASRPCPREGWREGIEYRADEAYLDEHDLLPLYPVNPPDDVDLTDYRQGWHSARYMPKWATRHWLTLTHVEPQRLQEITHGDIEAEGIVCRGKCVGSCFIRFRALWDTLNAKRGFGWDKNPWVWKLTFQRSEP